MATLSARGKKLSDYALWFTMTTAIITGILWIMSLAAKSFDKNGTITSVFAALTAVGGIAMGLIRLALRKSSNI